MSKNGSENLVLGVIVRTSTIKGCDSHDDNDEGNGTEMNKSIYKIKIKKKKKRRSRRRKRRGGGIKIVSNI